MFKYVNFKHKKILFAPLKQLITTFQFPPIQKYMYVIRGKIKEEINIKRNNINT